MLEGIRRVAAWLLYPFGTPERRRTTVTMLVVLGAYALQYARAQPMHAAPHGDGFFSWVYATSLAFDGDIDLTNDYALCGRSSWIVDAGGGRPANPYYFGPALLWTPILFVVRLLVRLPPNASAAVQHACAGPYVHVVGATSSFFTMLTIWLSYRVARRWVSQPYALAGALVGAFGTTLVTYGSPVWFYSHMWSALGVALAMFTFVRATERPESLARWALFGLAVAFAALVRPQEGLWILLGVVWAIGELATARPRLPAVRRVLLPAIAWTLGFASLYWVQLVVYKKLYGVYWLVTQGKLWLQLRHPHPILMLFSSYSGWFTWTPLAWLGLFGAVRMAVGRRERMMGVGLLLACALETYVSSAALAWTGSGTWGQRMLTSLAAPVVVGAAVAARSFGEWVLRRPDRARFVLVLACTFPLMFVTWGTPFVSPASSRGADVYGAAVSQNFKYIGDNVGNPFTLPAQEAFALRYGLPRQKFDDMAFTGHFVRDYRTATTQAFGTLSFNAPPEWVSYAEGITLEKDGARIASGRGRFLVTLYWPWVTHVRLAVKLGEGKETKIRLRTRGVLLGDDLGEKVYAPGSEDLEWALPKDALTSGINEVIVTADHDVTLRTLEFFDRTAHDLSLH